MRLLLNTVYAFLAEQCDAADRAGEPAFLVAGAKGEDLDALSRRGALDAWLDAPSRQQTEEEQALIRYLGVA